MSDPNQTLQNELRRIVGERNTINIVGNAASLLGSRYGVEIDTGCVVRMNSGVPIKPAAQGRRTDIHCFSTESSLLYNLSRASWRVKLKRRHFDELFSIWMSASERENCTRASQLFYPLSMLEKLTMLLGAPPSVGAKVIHVMSELTDARLVLFGFDFKKSGTFYRKKENYGPHDWTAEAAYAFDLARSGRLEIRT